MIGTRSFLWACVAVVALGTPNTATAQQRRPERPERPGGFFERLDKNEDGKLTREELPEAIRRNFDRVDTNRDGAITRQEDAAFRQRSRTREGNRPGQPRAPEGIRSELDVPYAGTDNPRQRLDVFLPKEPKGDKPLPVIAWIHGGAWRGGDKRSGMGQLARLVASGHYAGVSIGYRLTGESIWPTQIQDCKAAVRWIRANARKYNFDPERIGVWGSSAGGHLVAMLGTAGDVKELEGKLGKHIGQSSRVTCVVDYFGPADLLTMGKYPSSMKHDAADSPESLLVGGPLQETKEAARSASPITYASKDDPPFLIVHGDKDPLVPYNQSERLTEALGKASVDVTLIKIIGGGHGGFRGEELPRRVRLFLDKHLRGLDAEISGEAIPQGDSGRRR